MSYEDTPSNERTWIRGLSFSAVLAITLLVAAGPTTIRANELFGLGEASETSARAAAEIDFEARGTPAESVQAVLASSLQKFEDSGALGSYLPTPDTLAIQPDHWVARVPEPTPKEDGTIRISVTILGRVPVPGRWTARELAPVSEQAGSGASQDMVIFGRADELRRRLQLVETEGRRPQLVLARRTRSLGKSPRARLPAALGTSAIQLRGVSPEAATVTVPLAPHPVDGHDAYWSRSPEGTPASEVEYRKAVRTATGWNLNFEKIEHGRHPISAPALPVGIELSDAAFDAAGMGSGDWAWVVWWTGAKQGEPQ